MFSGKAQGLEADDGLPDSLQPVLEEQPKWSHLAEVLAEIERDAYFNPRTRDDSNGSVLVMCSDQATCRQLREYLQNMHVRRSEAPDDESRASADFILRRKLRNYLNWKKEFARVSASLFAENQKALEGFTPVAEQRNSTAFRGKGPPNKRRRLRGGGSTISSKDQTVQAAGDKDAQVASLLADLQPNEAENGQKEDLAFDNLSELEDAFELIDLDDLVVVHPYDGDLDEHVLEEVRPRHVIMYEPDSAFIRQVEVYRSSHTDRHVRVYFMYYGDSVEEQRYLSAVRREKDAFTKLIKEKAVSVI